MTPEQALSFVQTHGVVLASAKGPVPRLAEIIVGEPIKGSWWAHPQGKLIFRIFSALAESDEILVCRLVGGKMTFVHRRLWPALIRAAERFPAETLARVDQMHTQVGRHVNHEVPFPQWADSVSLAQAESLGIEEALLALGPWAV